MPYMPVPTIERLGRNGSKTKSPVNHKPSESEPVQATVEFNGLPPIQSQHAQLLPGTTTKFTLSEELMLRNATRHTRSVHVTSDGDVLVQAVYELVDSGLRSSGG